jgi:peptide/nickel transport system substrate-binding protein
MTLVQSQLRQIGLQVDVVPEEINQLISQWTKGQYDGIYYAIEYDSIDPARNSEFWMSSGSFHLWNPGERTPATAWEAQIDDLMRRQSTTLDLQERVRLFRQAQLVFSEHLPCLYFAAPKATVAMTARVAGAMPSVLQPPILWNAEALSVTAPPRP